MTVSALFAGVVILGCQNLVRPPSVAPASEVAEDKSHIISSVKVYLQDGAGKDAYWGDFDRTTCTDGLPTLWSSVFTSTFGDQRFDIDFSPLAEKKGNIVSVKAGSERFQVTPDQFPKALVAQGLCDLPFRTESTHFKADSDAGKELMSILTSVAPDCRFQSTPDGKMDCGLATATETDLRNRIDTLTRNMSTKWNHQPYLLIRRMTLTKQLLEAAALKDNSKNVHKFCRILKFSLPNELPLAFRSAGWQSQVCRDKDSNHDVMLIGLDQAIREIESLAHRIEDTSQVGTFTLSVPHDKSPSKEYWITLQPMDLPEIAKSENTQNACVWHPVFADQMDKELIAMELGQISSPSKKSFCAPIPELAKEKKESNLYIRASIASEMEFPIGNGQSKQLRLPTGDYKYSITQQNGPFSEEMFTTEEIIPISVGQVSWSTPKPHLVIRNW